MARSVISAALALLVRWSGLAWLVRTTIARRRVSILLYHDPRPALLEQHLAFLAGRYRFVRLEDVVDALHSGDWQAIPPRAVAITIDDGHRGNAGLGDLFRRHGVVPTLYVCTQIVGTNRHFWFLDVDDPEPLKALSEEHRARRLRELGLDETREHAPGERQALSVAELRAFGDAVSVQSHARFHPILPTCDEGRCRLEIAGSRSEVADLTGRPADHFSYPNGDYTAREIALVKDAGYRSARTTDVGWVGPRTDPYRLPVLGPWRDDVPVSRLAADLSGITSYLAYAVRGRLRGRKRPILAGQRTS